MSRRLSSLLAVACVLVLPATAAAAPAKQPAPQPTPAPEATVRIKLDHLNDGRAEIYSKVRVLGTVSPYVAGEQVQVTAYLDGKKLFTRNLAVGQGKGGIGTFETGVG
ncbi:MAG TPA: hypothetical protein VNR67_04120, partial [Solirubrobacterales bacterium]|nr:hypothetical protein [Solirubrobacterales bacterium]